VRLDLRKRTSDPRFRIQTRHSVSQCLGLHVSAHIEHALYSIHYRNGKVADGFDTRLALACEGHAICVLAGQGHLCEPKDVPSIVDAIECVFNMSGHMEPKTLADTMSCLDAESWIAGALAEIEAHLTNGTWELAQLPPGRVGDRVAMGLQTQAEAGWFR